MDFHVYFRVFDPELFPSGGDLRIELYNGSRTKIAESNTPDADDEHIEDVSVTANQTYYLRVLGASEDEAINGYDLTVINRGFGGPEPPAGEGPQVTGIWYNDQNTEPPPFDPKPTENGPTPLVNSLVIYFQDLPNRRAADGNLDMQIFDENVAENPVHYLLVGDHNGIIPIRSVDYTPNLPQVEDAPAVGDIELFFVNPLPDDRYTLTIFDSCRDTEGNALDGESNASQPLPADQVRFPSGDGLPGGDFVARFTVDSRPEVGTWAARAVSIDINGNGYFDPENPDFTNRDLVFRFGQNNDDVFAGRFVLDGNGVATGFDSLAAYGLAVTGATPGFRWLIDRNGNGVAGFLSPVRYRSTVDLLLAIWTSTPPTATKSDCLQAQRGNSSRSPVQA